MRQLFTGAARVVVKGCRFFLAFGPSPPPHTDPLFPPPPPPPTHTYSLCIFGLSILYCCSAGLPTFWSTTIFITTLSGYNLTIAQEISLSLISLSSSTVIRCQSVVYCVFMGAFAHMIFSFPFFIYSFTSNNEGVYF